MPGVVTTVLTDRELSILLDWFDTQTTCGVPLAADKVLAAKIRDWRDALACPTTPTKEDA